MFAGGAAYEQFMGRWSRRLAPLLVTFAGIADGDFVLDAGCGTASLSFAIGDMAPSARLTCIDHSAAYVDRAQASGPGDRMRFLVGDVQALAFADDTFNKALSLLVMNFVPAPARALQEMTRVTRPAGVVAAAVWDYGDAMEMLRAFWDEAVALDPASASRDERNMPLCRPGELEALWRAGGLERVEEQPTRDRDALHVVRRLLAAVSGWTGARWRARGGTCRFGAQCASGQTTDPAVWRSTRPRIYAAGSRVGSPGPRPAMTRYAFGIEPDGVSLSTA